MKMTRSCSPTSTITPQQAQGSTKNDTPCLKQQEQGATYSNDCGHNLPTRLRRPPPMVIEVDKTQKGNKRNNQTLNMVTWSELVRGAVTGTRKRRRQLWEAHTWVIITYLCISQYLDSHTSNNKVSLISDSTHVHLAISSWLSLTAGNYVVVSRAGGPPP